MKTRIYIACASDEIDRAEHWIGRVKEESALRLTHDWTKQIRREQKNGRKDSDLTRVERYREASKNADGAANADILWTLAPHPDLTTKGTWIEYGIGLGIRYRLGKAQLVLSGDHLDSTLFTTLAKTFTSDAEAFEYIRQISSATAQR